MLKKCQWSHHRGVNEVEPLIVRGVTLSHLKSRKRSLEAGSLHPTCPISLSDHMTRREKWLISHHQSVQGGGKNQPLVSVEILRNRVFQGS